MSNFPPISPTCPLKTQELWVESKESALYNGMVSPWNDFSIRAALWYQVPTPGHISTELISYFPRNYGSKLCTNMTRVHTCQIWVTFDDV